MASSNLHYPANAVPKGGGAADTIIDAPNMSPLIKKLAARLETELKIPVDPTTFRRVRPGRHQRAAGAWSWTIKRRDSVFWIGSTYPVKVIVEAEHICAGSTPFHILEVEIYPEKPPPYRRIRAI
jgi:hypothetical protein